METPVIIAEGEVEQFKSAHKIWREIDIYKDQLAELYEVNFPAAQNDEVKKAAYIQESTPAQCWAYFPWSGVLLRTVTEPELFQLRTNRNKNLLTQEEQEKCGQACVGVFGLSVGNSIAVTLAYSGIGGQLRLGDFDKISTTNLNRLHASLSDVGRPKIQVAAQQIWELNPFAKLDLFDQGVKEADLARFFGEPKPLLVFDEIDDFQMKIKLRLKAKEEHIPVVMLTSLGDSVLIDVERFDLDPGTTLFNGLIGDTPEEILRSEIGEREKIKYAIDLVGSDYIPARALESLFEINRTLIGRPQLAGTIMIDGGLAAFVARQIILGQSMPSGRYYLSLDKTFGIKNDDGAHKSAVAKLDQLLGR